MAGDAVVLDSGALSALAEGNKTLLNAIKKDLTEGGEVYIPSAVIAESLSGDQRRDVRMNALLKGILVVDLDAKLARAAAALRHANRPRRCGTIDAIVVATADRIPATRLLTTDAGDLRPLAAVHGRSIVVSV